ncbi:VOC family protein [Agilicoccus flavus]|uniref:VOC family protein n=1 Tax=Agilicoccus flavus TaxID=2775968 RepID=UPI001CF60961|nr:VOC family protein [Agilicoccus flavus]
MPDFTGSRLDHLNIVVSDMERALAFYAPALESIGIVSLMDVPPGATGPDGPWMHGFGWEHKPFFWLVQGRPSDPPPHVAFTVPTRDDVRAFHEAALAAGATSRDAPAVRAEYHPTYYGAFVNDPDGVNVEAVCHAPE